MSPWALDCAYLNESQLPGHRWAGNVLAVRWERPCWRGSSLHKAGRRKDDSQAGYSTLYLPKISLTAIPSHSHVKQAATCDHTVQHILVFKNVHIFVPLCPLGGIGIQNLHFHCKPWKTSSIALWCVPLICVLKWSSAVLFFSKRWKCIQISFRIQFLIFKKEIWKNGTDVYY